MAGILFLTLYPFQFEFTRHSPRPLFPFSLGGFGKHIGPFDDFLNVLLFVPFGFGLADKLREHVRSGMQALVFTFAAGVLVSYTIELLQIYIPQRDSGWEDVATNSFGALAGAILFSRYGGKIYEILSAAEQFLEARLTPKRTVLVVMLYIACWSTFAVGLQREISLSNWNPDSLLVIGNTVENHFSPAWKGRILALEMWDHALPTESALRLTSQAQPDISDLEPIVAYGFSGSAPFQDQRHLLSDLSWVLGSPIVENSSGAFFNGNSWLTSRGNVSALVSEIEKTGQFSVRVSCEPVGTSQVDARIFSISSRSGITNLEARQKNDSLVLWFRTTLSLDRSKMSWTIPNSFVANETRNILLSFDGTDANLFVNGKRQSGNYRVGPGVVLARIIHHVKAHELLGYQLVFYSMVFFPAGCLIGLASRLTTLGWFTRASTMLFGMMLPSLFLEVVLRQVSGRAVSFVNIVLSIVLVAVGSLWINAGRISWTRSELASS